MGCERADEQVQQKLPGLVASLEPDCAMHTTDTIDLIFVLSGEISLELDDGQEVLLRAGDSVVQNGTQPRMAQPRIALR